LHRWSNRQGVKQRYADKQRDQREGFHAGGEYAYVVRGVENLRKKWAITTEFSLWRCHFGWRFGGWLPKSRGVKMRVMDPTQLGEFTILEKTAPGLWTRIAGCPRVSWGKFTP